MTKLTSSFFHSYLHSIIGVKLQTEKNIQTCKYLRKERPLDTIILDPKDIGMADIKKATEKFLELYINGKKTTLEYLTKYVLI